ncbi:hypothetical protein TRPE111910_11735 [Treponema peruense]
MKFTNFYGLAFMLVIMIQSINIFPFAWGISKIIFPTSGTRITPESRFFILST